MAEKTFTAIIDTFNRPGLLKEAVGALRRQTYPKLEIILVANGSTLETLAYLDAVSHEDPRIKLVRFRENQYGADDPLKMLDTCLNAALEAATGDFVWYQADDDMVADDYAEKMVRLFEDNPECVTAAGLPVAMDWAGRRVDSGPRRSNRRPRYMPGLELAQRVLRGDKTVFAAPGTIFTIRREALVKAGGFHRALELSHLYGIVPFGVSAFDETAVFYWRRHEGQLNKSLSARGWLGVDEVRSLLRDWNLVSRWRIFGVEAALEMAASIESELCRVCGVWFINNLAALRPAGSLRIAAKMWNSRDFWIQAGKASIDLARRKGVRAAIRLGLRAENALASSPVKENPMSIVRRRTTCRLCESPKVELVVPLAPIPLAEKYLTETQLDRVEPRYPIDLSMCADCGHVQLLDAIDPKVLWADFTFWSGQAPKIVQHLGEVADQTCRTYEPKPGSLVVDVGSNDGTLLKAFQRNGLKALGIDPAVEIARKATESGVETIPEFVTPALAKNIHAERGGASIVTCFNAFAHSDDMAGIAESIRELLADDGVFVFEVSYLLDILDNMLLGVIFHEHMGHHSLIPLVKFLKNHGMEIIDVQRNDLQGGSLIGFAQRAGGKRKIQPSVGELLSLEKSRGLDKTATVKEFSTRLKKLKGEMGELLADWRKRGATVAAYGAARSGPTLIGELGLGKDLSFIVDDHPQKVNKFSPGDHLPVLPTAELYKRKPDFVIILAWVHAQKIIADNRKFLEQGGRFVLCCPEIKVIGLEQAAAR